MSDEQVVQLQHRLTAALQELSNLERFTKQQQHVSGDVDKRLHNLLQEEAYLTERLLLVKKVCQCRKQAIKPICARLTIDAFVCATVNGRAAGNAAADVTDNCSFPGAFRRR